VDKFCAAGFGVCLPSIERRALKFRALDYEGALRDFHAENVDVHLGGKE